MYSRELGIDLSGGDSEEIFKWFLASKLFGARISSDIAARTYREFERCGVCTPKRIQETGWDGLVKILDDGGYVRYDFSTATKLLEITAELERSYGGDLNRLHDAASDFDDLRARLKWLGKGIGDVTVNIFLRELRSVWTKARPEPSRFIRSAARNLALTGSGDDLLDSLGMIWSRGEVPGRGFCDFEAALLRLGKDYCGKSRCASCPVRSHCKRRKVP
jgi:endonuclease III